MAATVKHPSGGCWIVAAYDNEKLRQRSRLETTLNLLSPISHITKISDFMKGFSNCFQIVNVRLLLHLFTIPRASKNNNISWFAFFYQTKKVALKLWI